MWFGHVDQKREIMNSYRFLQYSFLVVSSRETDTWKTKEEMVVNAKLIFRKLIVRVRSRCNLMRIVSKWT
jgi:hypothetical protein